ncbi:uncharacterized protein si:ch211-207j7.2 [Esox lucius]|uniref:uncharacterized protein si:ch211-207j7.2 n=1 Tax=Esox lucius TaxID=8010 RepID=UPI001476AD3B|nr:uncharacterized protein si:ch211-207j7.2 [Esox lucius]
MATVELVAKRRCSANSLDEWAGEFWTEGELNTTQGREPRPPPPALLKHGPIAPGDSKPGLQLTFSSVDITDTTSEMAEVVPKIEQVARSGVSRVFIRKIQTGDVVMERELEMIEDDDPREKVRYPAILPLPHACTDLPMAPGGDLEMELKPASAYKEEESVGRSDDGQTEVSHRVGYDPATSDNLGSKQLKPKPLLDDSHWVKTIAKNPNHGTVARPTNHSPLKIDSLDYIIPTTSQEDIQPSFASGGENNQSVDSKPLDINSARRQWVRLDSTSSKPPLPQSEQPKNTSRSSSPGHLEDLAQAVVTSNELQGELLQRATATARQPRKQEVRAQQVFKGATPTRSLTTVTKEPANQVEGGLPGSGCVVEEQAGGENRQTGGEREQRASRLGGAAGEAGRKKEQGVKGFKRAPEEQTKAKKATPGVKSQGGHHKTSGMELGGDMFDDNQSDSGVSADFSPGSTGEFRATTPDSLTTPTPPPANETPIEKEIRRALEREQSLRKSRGLHVKPPTHEYVDVPLKTSVLTQTLPSRSDRSQVRKERQFAGKIMQREINVETQREEVLVQLGKVRGSYYKGTVRQLKERKKLFEVFQDPEDVSLTLSQYGSAPSWASASDLSVRDIQRDDTSSVSDIRGSYGERRHSLAVMSQSPSGTPKGFPYTTPGTPVPRGPTLSESTGGQIIILESHSHLVLPAPAHQHPPIKLLRGSRGVEERKGSWRDDDGAKTGEEDEEDAPKENPFFKLRSSSASQDKVEQDIREAREREMELRRQRSSLYGGGVGGVGGGGGPTSGEGQDAARYPSPPLSQNNGLASADLPVTPHSRRASATQTGRQSLGKLGLWPPPQTDDSLDGQSEGLQSPHTPRLKTPLLQRWESGMVMNGTGAEEED